jgi:hypothetical protein
MARSTEARHVQRCATRRAPIELDLGRFVARELRIPEHSSSRFNPLMQRRKRSAPRMERRSEIPFGRHRTVTK